MKDNMSQMEFESGIPDSFGSPWCVSLCELVAVAHCESSWGEFAAETGPSTPPTLSAPRPAAAAAAQLRETAIPEIPTQALLGTHIRNLGLSP